MSEPVWLSGWNKQVPEWFNILKKQGAANQNQTLHSQKLKRKVHKHKINGNHPNKKRKEQRRSIESIGKQGLKRQ